MHWCCLGFEMEWSRRWVKRTRSDQRGAWMGLRRMHHSCAPASRRRRDPAASQSGVLTPMEFWWRTRKSSVFRAAVLFHRWRLAVTYDDITTPLSRGDEFHRDDIHCWLMVTGWSDLLPIDPVFIYICYKYSKNLNRILSFVLEIFLCLFWIFSITLYSFWSFKYWIFFFFLNLASIHKIIIWLTRDQSYCFVLTW